MPTGSATTYAAVVLHYHDPAALQECVRALLGQTVPPIQIVVVDNGSAPGELDAFAVENRLSLLREPKNVGYGAAMDDGRHQAADAAAILFVTQDCVIEPGAGAALLAALEADSTVGAAGPLLRRRSDATQVWSAGGRLRGLTLWPSHSLTSQSQVYDTAWLDGAAMMVRNSVFNATTLDRGYFLYFEDVEFCVRMRTGGLRVVVVPGAIARQEPGDLNVYLATRNHVRFVRRNGNIANVTAALVRHWCYVGADLLRLASSYRRQRLRQRLYGLVDAFTDKLRADEFARTS